MKVIGHIYEEDNYDVFVRLKDNRDVLSNRLNKLVASISEKYVLNPIIVNEKMEIIDGQGRYEALKTLGRPIHYIVASGTNSDDCRRMNKFNTKWGNLDFAKSYAKAGKQAYANLLLACKKTDFPILRVLRLCNRKAVSSRSNEMGLFESGRLKFTEEDIELVVRLQKMILEIQDALQFTGRLNEAFTTGVKVCVETKGYNHTHMLKNCNSSRSTFAQMSRLADQLKEFERIYNKGLTAKNKLFFSDFMRNSGSNVRDYNSSHWLSQYTDEDVSTLKMEDDYD